MNRGIAFALGSAVLFGMSTPLAKLLVGAMSPLLLAGLLYARSGLGLLLVLGVRRLWARNDFAMSLPRREGGVGLPLLSFSAAWPVP